MAFDLKLIKLEHYPKSKDLTLLEDQIKNMEQKKDKERISKQNELNLNRKLLKLQDNLQKHQMKHRFQLTPNNFPVTDWHTIL